MKSMRAVMAATALCTWVVFSYARAKCRFARCNADNDSLMQRPRRSRLSWCARGGPFSICC